MRPQIPPLLATAADRVEPKILPPIENKPAVYAAAFKEFAVHMAECLRACAFVEVIYVLSDEEKLAAVLHKVVFESREGAMSRVGGDGGCLHLASTLIIKVVNQRWITCKAFGRGDIFDAMLFPQAIACAKGLNPRLCRNAGAG
jgi:hypothetical protein